MTMLTASEKVEIARRIEVALGGRNHRPSAETLQNLADLPQGNSRDLAAQSVGWSGETYRKAKAVVEEGGIHACFWLGSDHCFLRLALVAGVILRMGTVAGAGAVAAIP